MGGGRVAADTRIQQPASHPGPLQGCGGGNGGGGAGQPALACSILPFQPALPLSLFFLSQEGDAAQGSGEAGLARLWWAAHIRLQLSFLSLRSGVPPATCPSRGIQLHSQDGSNQEWSAWNQLPPSAAGRVTWQMKVLPVLGRLQCALPAVCTYKIEGWKLPREGDFWGKLGKIGAKLCSIYTPVIMGLIRNVQRVGITVLLFNCSIKLQHGA